LWAMFEGPGFARQSAAKPRRAAAVLMKVTAHVDWNGVFSGVRRGKLWRGKSSPPPIPAHSG
jgi:hypothetical protein